VIALNPFFYYINSICSVKLIKNATGEYRASKWFSLKFNKKTDKKYPWHAHYCQVCILQVNLPRWYIQQRGYFTMNMKCTSMVYLYGTARTNKAMGICDYNDSHEIVRTSLTFNGHMMVFEPWDSQAWDSALPLDFGFSCIHTADILCWKTIYEFITPHIPGWLQLPINRLLTLWLGLNFSKEFKQIWHQKYWSTTTLLTTSWIWWLVGQR
jgi:hypothetical protein